MVIFSANSRHVVIPYTPHVVVPIFCRKQSEKDARKGPSSSARVMKPDNSCYRSHRRHHSGPKYAGAAGAGSGKQEVPDIETQLPSVVSSSAPLAEKIGAFQAIRNFWRTAFRLKLE